MATIKRESGTLTPKPTKKVEKDKVVGFELPTSKNKPMTHLWDYILLLFGEKKIGKTSLLAENSETTFFAMFEPGAKALEVYSTLFTRWADFKSAVRALTTDKRFELVVIDTVDLAYKISEAYTYKKLGIEHASDEAYGKGWAAVRKEFTDQIMMLVNSGKGVAFISHATEKEISVRGGGKYDRIVPTMPGQARDVIEGLVDIWAYYGYDGHDRVLTIVGDDHIGAGHRLNKQFRFPDGKPIREIHMGKNAAESFKNFTDAFNNRYVPPVRKVEEESTGGSVKIKKLKKKV